MGVTHHLPLRVEPVADAQWGIVAWLWQAFRADLSPVVGGLPYSDGRYQHRELDTHPSPDGAGYLAWRPHPNSGEPAPVGFALVSGLGAARSCVAAFWIAPAARRAGVGRVLAHEVLSRHRGPWAVAFQHDNAAAQTFWRAVADAVFSSGGWVELRRPVPGRPDVPPDHVIESRA